MIADRPKEPITVRVQLEFTEAQDARLRTLARQRSCSVGDLVRRSVSEYLARRPTGDRDALARRDLAAAGRFRSGVPDLA